MYSNVTTNLPKEILTLTKKLSPRDHEEMKKEIAEILGDALVSVIDTHNTESITFIFSHKNKKYLMKAELQNKVGTVGKEITWYSKVGNLFSNCPRYLGSIKGKGIIAILLSFIDNSSTMDDLVLQSKIDTHQTWKLINKSLELLNLLFENNPKRKVTLTKADRLFIGKYKSRLQEAQSHEYLQKLFNPKNLRINGQPLPSFNYYISKIAGDKKLREFLTPKVCGVIHGDLHCGNILVKDNEVYFVDPNGNLLMPIEYDYGKIFHSIHGGYGSIIRGDYKLRELNEGEFEFSIRLPKAYQTTFERFSKTLPQDLFVRSLYAEAMHFATMLPHHASSEEETKALFLQGITLFKELFGKINA